MHGDCRPYVYGTEWTEVYCMAALHTVNYEFGFLLSDGPLEKWEEGWGKYKKQIIQAKIPEKEILQAEIGEKKTFLQNEI